MEEELALALFVSCLEKAYHTAGRETGMMVAGPLMVYGPC